MSKLKIAVVVEENCLPTEGGGYTYYQTWIKEIDRMTFHPEIEMSFLLPNANSHYPFSKKCINGRPNFISAAVYATGHKLYRLIHWLFPTSATNQLQALTKLLSNLSNKVAISALIRENIDLVYYLKPQDNPMDYPMIVTHWDVGHKSMFPFPEVAHYGNYIKRESYYASILSKALLILCESNSGATEFQKFYPVNPGKVKVLPLFAGEVVQITVLENEQNAILARYEIESNAYYLYPAQFWAHKNHYNLVLAFRQLIDKTGNEKVKLVLCGSDQGNLAYIRQLVLSLQLEQRVIFTGFINNRVLYTFYKHAISLVMPTYLGPTNLPLIEAALLRCPVICSDLPGHHEILGDEALYINPANASSIVDSMAAVLDCTIRERLRDFAYERISQSAFNLQKSLKALEKILLEIKPVRKAWGPLSKVLQLVTYANIGLDTI
jgi:glycosyltransferase involved in cell wall biosynthesis